MNIKELKQILYADSVASGRNTTAARFFGDEVWKFQRSLRVLEYYGTLHGVKKLLLLPVYVWVRVRYHRLSLKLGFSIPVNVFDEGLSIPHYGTIVVSKYAKAGRNCRIHEGVTIGATNGTRLAPRLGNNVFIGSGAKIMGGVSVADDVCIGANAVVTSSISEPGTTWGGIPARKISDNDSHSNLNPKLFS